MGIAVEVTRAESSQRNPVGEWAWLGVGGQPAGLKTGSWGYGRSRFDQGSPPTWSLSSSGHGWELTLLWKLKGNKCPQV